MGFPTACNKVHRECLFRLPLDYLVISNYSYFFSGVNQIFIETGASIAVS